MNELDYLEQYTQECANEVADHFWDELSKTCSSQKKPQLCIIGGQPGAGKTGSKNKIKSNLNNNVLSIDYDDIRAKHPNAKLIYLNGKEDSSDYSERTAKFSKEVGNILIQRAVEHNYNILIEKTMNKSSSIKDLIERCPNYDINIFVMTCNAIESNKKVKSRYEKAKTDFKQGKSDEPPRCIKPEYIDKCLRGLGKATQEIATDPAIKLKNLRIEVRDEHFNITSLFDINAKKSQKLSTRLLESDPNKIKQIIDDAIDIKNQTISKSKEQER